jgi:hypothetical protein
MVPKVVCQQSFFTRPAHLQLPVRVRLGPRDLTFGPAVQGLVPQPPHLVDGPSLCLVGARQIAAAVGDDIRQRLHATL